MKQCKECLEMYNLPGPTKWGEIRFLGIIALSVGPSIQILI